jgi:putative FmdB family regulatory protein
MPIYGYQCTQCGHQFEVLQSFSDPAPRACPECMGPLEKLLYPVGVIFKGSGFYTTDYKAAGAAGSRKADSDGSGKSDSAKDAAKSENKRENKGEKAVS